MDKFDRSLARIAKNIMSAADSIDSVEGKLLLYLVAGEIGAEAMRPEEDASENGDVKIGSSWPEGIGNLRM